MPKLRLIGLTLLALSATAVSHAEETRYVSDELNTWVRSGPGDHYRLVGTVNAGEEVTLLQTDANTNYAQVKDSSGRTAWIPLKQLSTEPSLRSRVPDLENQVKTLTDKLTNINKHSKSQKEYLPAVKRYANVAHILGLSNYNKVMTVRSLVNWIQFMQKEMNIPLTIQELGTIAPEEYFAAIDKMADAALADACTVNNPRVPTKEDIIKIYTKLWSF